MSQQRHSQTERLHNRRAEWPSGVSAGAGAGAGWVTVELGAVTVILARVECSSALCRLWVDAGMTLKIAKIGPGNYWLSLLQRQTAEVAESTTGWGLLVGGSWCSEGGLPP